MSDLFDNKAADIGIDSARKFLDTLWPDEPAGQLVMFFLARNGGTKVRWCNGVEGVLKEFSTHVDNWNVYLGACSQDWEQAKGLGSSSRGNTQTAVQLPGVFVDIDIASPGHKAKNLVPDWDTAIKLANSTGLEPSIIVNSGHGLQAWWLFEGAASLEGDFRSERAGLLASFVATIQQNGKDLGDYKVDSVGDLARVLRMPGSFNYKTDPRRVTAEYSGKSYLLADIDGACIERKYVLISNEPYAGPIEDADEATVAIVEQCIPYLSSDRADDYEQWVQVGMALKGAGGETLRKAWHDFSKKSAAYDPEIADQKWDSFQPQRIGTGSIIKMSRDDATLSGQKISEGEVGSVWDLGGEVPEVEPEGPAAVPVAIPEPKTTTATSNPSKAPEGVSVHYSTKHAVAGSSSGRMRVSNVIDSKIDVKTDSGVKEVDVVNYRPIVDIASMMIDATGGWPKRTGSLLFTVDSEATVKDISSRPVHFLQKPDQFFAWLQKHADVRWHSGHCKHAATGDKVVAPTKQEFFEFLKLTVNPSFSAVEVLPHYPPVDSIFYVPTDIPPFDPTTTDSPLYELLSGMNPETELDRSLILAALLTPAWGGPCGARPAFVFTSEHGVGVGKTSTAEALSEIWGGNVSVSAHEDWDTVRKRLLGDESLTKRIVIIDNLKGRLNSGELEGAITMKNIDGWRPYHGQSSRPNRMTWFITANDPSLSKDLADRSVVIKIGPSKHGVDFVQWASNHVAKYRGEILAELFAILRRGPVCKIDKANSDRWAGWQNAILSRLDSGNELAKLCVERRPAVDADADDAAEVYREFEKLFVARGHADFEGKRIFITSAVTHDMLKSEDVSENRYTRRQTMHWLMPKVGRGALKNFKVHRHGELGKGWMYIGPMARDSSNIVHIEQLPRSEYGSNHYA